MSTFRNRRPSLTWALACASVLAACGGGGSSTPSTAAKVALSGVASKGLMANADVKVHPVKADGSVDLTVILATATTDANGNYTVSFDGNQGQPYVVRVSAKADGSTTHLDEVSGTSKALPAGFAMRAVIIPASSGSVTTSATVTPFSEMAVAAAAKATGGVTAANARQANSSVAQLLGFDPTKVAVKKTDDGTASDDEKKLAVMLTAVSKLANDSALGCTTSSSTTDDKTKCVVEKLAASTSAGSLKLEDSSGGSTQDVSAALSGAVGGVLADDKLRGTVTAGVLAAITGTLDCAATNSCTAVSSTVVDSAISGAKAMLTQLKSDWLSLFGGGTTSAASIEAGQINQAFNGVQMPAEVWAKDMGAIILGTELYRKVGSTGVLTVGRGAGLVGTEQNFFSTSQPTAFGCVLYQDANTTTPATSAANANFIGCSARYFVTINQTSDTTTTTTSRTEWRHGFTITPVKTAGVLTSFTYQTRARKHVDVTTRDNLTGLQTVSSQNISLPSGIDTLVNSAPTTERFEGTYTPTVNAGDLTGFALTGTLPGAFNASVHPVNGSLPLVNDHHSISFIGSATVNVAAGTVAATATGSIKAFDGAGNNVSSFSVTKGSINASSTATGGMQPTLVDLAFTWSTPSATFDGALTVPGTSFDKSGFLVLPTSATLTGKLNTIHSGTVTPFFTGTVTGSLSGLAAFDATRLPSSTNFYSVDVSVSGSVTAPGRPRLELVLGTTAKNDGSGTGPTSANLTYRSFANGGTTPTQAVAIVFSAPTTPLGKGSASLTDLSKGFKIVADGAKDDVLVTTGDTAQSTVGMLDRGKKLLTFIDGSSVSLEFGL
ncbi:MAG: hypothetical protein RIQ60_2470 [Pseudomonadota bacterium]|jgi:hypothetical protein